MKEYARREDSTVETASGTTAWVDLASPSHPFFFRALIDKLPGVSFRTTVRDKTETVDLAAALGFDYTVLGRDFANPTLRKLGIPLRAGHLAVSAPSADFSLSSRNAMCILASKMRGIPSIHFTDNDITAHVRGLRAEELYNRLEATATHNVVPAAFETEQLEQWRKSGRHIQMYDGYKEDVYVADFEPDPDFTQELPFEEYLIIRPEALGATYVNRKESLVPELLRKAVDRGYSVVYLPRGRGDEKFAVGYDPTEVFVPENALDGLQLVWHSTCTLTGSGTMAREAACMEKPAVSFFPNTLLSVDQAMAEDGRLFYSRRPDAILDFVESLDHRDISPDLDRPRAVQQEVVDIVKGIIGDYT
jgi:predicted glycosyltransferase